MQPLGFLEEMKEMEKITIIRLLINVLLVVSFAQEISGQTRVELNYKIKKKDVPLSFPDTAFRTWTINNYEYDLLNNLDTIFVNNDTLEIVLSTFQEERKDERMGITCIDCASFSYSQRKFVQSILIPHFEPFIRIKYTICSFHYVFLFRHSSRLKYRLETYHVPSINSSEIKF